MLPAGFLENGESLQEGALREAYEEANIKAASCEMLSTIEVVASNQVHVFFQVQLDQPEFSPGVESLEVRLFTADQIPWDSIAFESVEWILNNHFMQKKSMAKPSHHVIR